MSPEFWFSNLHFAFEFLGAVILFIVAWLAFDTFLIKRDFGNLARILGFLFFAFWQFFHSLELSSYLWLVLASFFYFFGLIFLLLHFLVRKPLPRPEFKAVVVLPAPGILSIFFGLHIFAAASLAFIGFLTFRRYFKELEKAVLPLFVGFSLLTLASFLAIFNLEGQPGFLFGLEHLLKILGFLSFAFWVWQFLQLRIKEELLLIFVGMALVISTVVTLTFSGLLISRMEADAKSHLTSDVKVLEYASESLKNEALAIAELISRDKNLKELLLKKDEPGLLLIAQDFLDKFKPGFLIIADDRGEVLQRLPYLASRGDSILKEKAGVAALEGKSFVTVESVLPEGLSLRASSPIFENGDLLGAIIAGFIFDSSFVDGINKITGLEATVYKDNVRAAATTTFGPDGLSRNIGKEQSDPRVLKTVLKEGDGITLRTKILGRPYLAAYLPIRDADGKIVGMFEAAKAQTEILDAARTTNRLTLFTTIIIVVILMLPAYFIAKRISEEV